MSSGEHAEMNQRILESVTRGGLFLTLHAQLEMVEDGFTLDDLKFAIANSAVIEHYPDHLRGACCLICGT